MRLTLISAPHSSADNFFPSFKARELTVERGTASNSAYRRATFSSESIPDMLHISVNLPVKSTAFLPDEQPVNSGHSTGMNYAVIYENIQYLLKDKGRSADEVSRSAGVPEAIRNIKRRLNQGIKGQGMNAATLEALAAELQVTTDYLKTPHDRPNTPVTGGMRDILLAQLAFLDQQRAQIAAELHKLDDGESRKIRKRRR